jgi:hypothetical protein
VGAFAIAADAATFCGNVADVLVETFGFRLLCPRFELSGRPSGDVFLPESGAGDMSIRRAREVLE